MFWKILKIEVKLVKKVKIFDNSTKNLIKTDVLVYFPLTIFRLIKRHMFKRNIVRGKLVN